MSGTPQSKTVWNSYLLLLLPAGTKCQQHTQIECVCACARTQRLMQLLCTQTLCRTGHLICQVSVWPLEVMKLEAVARNTATRKGRGTIVWFLAAGKRKCSGAGVGRPPNREDDTVSGQEVNRLAARTRTNLRPVDGGGRQAGEEFCWHSGVMECVCLCVRKSIVLCSCWKTWQEQMGMSNPPQKEIKRNNRKQKDVRQVCRQRSECSKN